MRSARLPKPHYVLPREPQRTQAAHQDERRERRHPPGVARRRRPVATILFPRGASTRRARRPSTAIGPPDFSRRPCERSTPGPTPGPRATASARGRLPTVPRACPRSNLSRTPAAPSPFRRLRRRTQRCRCARRPRALRGALAPCTAHCRVPHSAWLLREASYPHGPSTLRQRGAQFGETEIEHLGAAGRQKYVARLQVPMQHVMRVRIAQRIGDLDRILECLVNRDRAARQARGQRLAVEELHDEIVDSAGAAGVEEAAEVRVLEHGTDLALAVEPRKGRRIRGKGIGNDLDGDVLVEMGISRTDRPRPCRRCRYAPLLHSARCGSPGKSASVSDSR